MGEVQEFYVTFGVRYTADPRFGDTHPQGMHHQGYAVIEAPDLHIAQHIADAVYGQGYAFIYDGEHFIDDGTRDRWHPAGELMRISWTMHDVPTEEVQP